MLGAKVGTWQSVMSQPRFGLVYICLKCFGGKYSTGNKLELYPVVTFINRETRQTKSEILTKSSYYRQSSQEDFQQSLNVVVGGHLGLKQLKWRTYSVRGPIGVNL